MRSDERYIHKHLSSGIELAALPMPGRRTVAFEFRFLAGMADEPADKLGLAKLVDETINKGTEQRTGQQLIDAFDAIGAQCGSWAGRESFVFRCSCLPEYLEQALALHAELLRKPTFPQEFCDVALQLAQQELTALEDDPDELARKHLTRHCYGPVLGRHSLGDRQTIECIGRADIVDFWRKLFSARRMQVSVGGAVDVDRFAAALDLEFTGFGDGASNGRAKHPLEFTPGFRHYEKELEQEYIHICWRGLEATHRDQPIEQLVLAVLGGGMSARLFTEVREKQGLVYWVGAWDEHPRGSGMVFLGASTTPQRCDLTYKTLLREVDRLAEDLAEEELNRARVGILAKTQTHGDITRARVTELSNDLFLHGRPVPVAEKNAKLEAVTIADVSRYLKEYPREPRCVVTLGPRALEGA